MSNKGAVAVLFAICLAGACTASSSLVPVAYGVSNMTPSVGVTSLLGILTSGVSGIIGFWKLFQNQGGTRVLEDLGGVLRQPQTASAVTAELALVVLAGLCVKSGDVDALAKVGELAKAMLLKRPVA